MRRDAAGEALRRAHRSRRRGPAHGRRRRIRVCRGAVAGIGGVLLQIRAGRPHATREARAFDWRTRRIDALRARSSPRRLERRARPMGLARRGQRVQKRRVLPPSGGDRRRTRRGSRVRLHRGRLHRGRRRRRRRADARAGEPRSAPAVGGETGGVRVQAGEHLRHHRAGHRRGRAEPGGLRRDERGGAGRRGGSEASPTGDATGIRRDPRRRRRRGDVVRSSPPAPVAVRRRHAIAGSRVEGGGEFGRERQPRQGSRREALLLPLRVAARRSRRSIGETRRPRTRAAFVAAIER
mmetsp:Transcript_5723/g.23665  ORF Transcript_5723/g.23665 Transcript_5723/m.23665 type:complete len:295 (-) Transcript_5723:196-1080(-)